MIINKGGEKDRPRQYSQFIPKSPSHTETFKCVTEKPHIVLDNKNENVNRLKTSIVIEDLSPKSVQPPYVSVGQVETYNTTTIVSSYSLQSSNDVASCLETSDNFVNTSTDSMHLVNEFFLGQKETSTQSKNEVTRSLTETSNTVENASSESIQLVSDSFGGHFTQSYNFSSNGKNDLVEVTDLLSHEINGKSKKFGDFVNVVNAAGNANQVCLLTVDPRLQYKTSTISAPCSQSTPLIDSSKPKLSIVSRLKECKDDQSILKLLCNLMKVKKRKKRKVSQGCFCNSSYTGSWTVTDKVKKIKFENETKPLDIDKKLTLNSSVGSKSIHSKFDNMLLETCTKNCEGIGKDLGYSPTLVNKEQFIQEKCKSTNYLSKSLELDVVDASLSEQTQNYNFMQLDEETSPGIISLEKPENVKLIPTVETTFYKTDELSKHTETSGHAILKQVSKLECKDSLIHNEKSEEIKFNPNIKKATFFQSDIFCNDVNSSLFNSIKRDSIEIVVKMSNSDQFNSSYCLNNGHQDDGEQEKQKHINHDELNNLPKDVFCNDQRSEMHPSLENNTIDLQSFPNNLKNQKQTGEITANNFEVTVNKNPREIKSLRSESPAELECEDTKVVSTNNFRCASNLRSQSESVTSGTHFIGFIPDEYANKDCKKIDLNNDRSTNKLSNNCETVGKKGNEGQISNKTVNSNSPNIHLPTLEHKKYLKRFKYSKEAIKKFQSKNLNSNSVGSLSKIKYYSFPEIEENLVPNNTDALSLSCTSSTQIAHGKLLTDEKLDSSILTHQDLFSKKLESVSQLLSSDRKSGFYDYNKNDKHIEENFIDFKIESEQEKSLANGFRSIVVTTQESNKDNREKFFTQAFHIHSEVKC